MVGLLSTRLQQQQQGSERLPAAARPKAYSSCGGEWDTGSCLNFAKTFADAPLNQARSCWEGKSCADACMGDCGAFGYTDCAYFCCGGS
jgi:hypothetical protein